jgi:hypothetical protein
MQSVPITTNVVISNIKYRLGGVIKGYILDVDVNIVMGGWEVLMFTHFSTIFQLYRGGQFY